MPILPLNENVVIVNVVSGRVLDADLGTINSDGTKVQLYGRDAANQPQRQWILVSAGDNRYHIVCAKSGRFLDADTQTIQIDGTKVQLYGADIPAPLNRQWQFVDLGDDRVFILNAQSGRYLEADINTIGSDATVVQLYGTVDGDIMPNRQWRVVRLADYEANKPTPHSFQDAPKQFDLLIIAPFAFSNYFDAFRTAKRSNGVESHMVLLTTTADGRGGVLNDFPGSDHPERVKRSIEYAYRIHKAKYVMLAGDASVFPTRWRYVREADDPSQGLWAGWHDGTYRPSDLYYASLYHHDSQPHHFDTWDQNGNNKFNEQQWGAGVAISYNPDGVDGYPDIAVGRIPAHEANEVQMFLQKIINYETRLLSAPGPQRFGFVADKNYPGGDQFSDDISNALPAAVVTSMDKALFNALPSDPLRPGWIRGQDGTFAQFAAGCWWISYVGHGSSAGWDFPVANFAPVQGLTNAPNFPIVFAAACDTAEFLGNPPFGQYQDNVERFRWFYYYTDTNQIKELDQNGQTLRTINKPLTVPTPGPYDLPSNRNRTLACAWLFNAGGGAIAYFGEVLVCEDDKGRDLEEDFFSALAKPFRTLGDYWLAAQQKYWNDNHNSDEVFRAPRIYLGIMTFFGDPSLRLPSL